MIAKTKEFDVSYRLLRDAYLFIPKLRAEYESDIIATRLMLRRSVVLSGPDAPALLYDETKMRRCDAIPLRVQKTLMGRHGIQTLDGDEHKHRKNFFMSLLTREKVAEFLGHVDRVWNEEMANWEESQSIILFPAVQDILCQAACDWAGVPLDIHERRKRARDLGWLVAGFGGIGPRYWRGKFARVRCENWIADLIGKLRSGEVTAPVNSILYGFSFYRDLKGELLPEKIAAVEVLNILRPIVAIATYICFTALALHRYPEKLEDSDEGRLNFIQEVRRFYPFTPLLGARATKDFVWKGYEFRKDQMGLLDVYGLLHDERIWEKADRFLPDRFKGKMPTPFDLIPQGGGDTFLGHRCAGEWLTIETMKLGLKFLSRAIAYDVPAQIWIMI